MILVEDAGLISPLPLIGVGPKNKHTALPGGQNAISPNSTVSFAHLSSSISMSVEKYISSPHVCAEPSIGKISSKALEVGETLRLASILKCPKSNIISLIGSS